jgi:pyruvate/2-oxoglutarate dehydrogenase complex dihydrolipoamide dehydrogenase (E3) component
VAETVRADLCVIGAGTGGLVVAAGASQMGAEVVLIESDRMGGDCLNYGCVPSKALLAAGHVAQTIRGAGAFGVNGHEPAIDFARVHDHVHEIIARIAPNDSQERFEGLGVRVIRARASFTGPDEVQAGDVRVRARRFVVATGSKPAAPPIPGLDRVPYFTNETIFDNRVQPEHLIVIGGGPIGSEMAQAHRRLGARVSVVDMGPILPKDDPELTAVVRERFEAEGITLFERVKVKRVERHGNGVAVTINGNGQERRLEGSDLLVAAGRRVDVEGLNLAAAGVEHDGRGIKVDARLRTSNRRIFAAGDCAGGPQFTHVAAYHAGIILRNALFHLPAKVDYAALPWVTYTDPELAHVGLTEARAKEKGESIEVLRWRFDENDRAQTERRTEGLVKVVTTRRRGRVLGASIVGPHAGELILPWVVAIGQRLKIGALANAIVPYPTLNEVSKRAAGNFYAPKLFSNKTRLLVRFLARFG